MIKTEIRLPIGYTRADLADAICAALPISKDEILSAELVKRTLNLNDKSDIHYTATAALTVSAEREAGLLKMRKRVKPHTPLSLDLPPSMLPTRPVIIGAGPAGLFCALALAHAGARPIIYERGLEVDKRREKVRLFNALGILDGECNVQYGEGGAGTFSDGKLKVGSPDKYKSFILRSLVEEGAEEDILYSVGAHLGTDKLSLLVCRIRERIISLGGEVHFSSRLTEIRQKDGKIIGGRVEKNGEILDFDTDNLIMATGHSARDSFELLRREGVPMERRGFGIGMRIEHPREYINRLMYGERPPEGLGTASYHLVTHLPGGRSVYSFCMCPGGTVVAAASEAGGIVTNGMSESARGAENSNAALLVSVTPEDFGSEDIFAGLDLQRKIEGRAYRLTSDYRAPAIGLDSFMNNTAPTLGGVRPSYPIGTVTARPESYLPQYVTDSLRSAMADFDSWLPGYFYPDAALTGPETRTTSPIRVLRDGDSYLVCGFDGLYAIGEGAGYAGGIISSARDGVVVAEALLQKYAKNI